MLGPLMPAGVEALLFDLGGVVVDIDFDRVFCAWAEAEGCDPAHLKDRFTFDEAYERHERGEVSMTQYCSTLRQSLGLTLSDARLVAAWNSLYVGVIPEILTLLNAALDSLRLFAFTNSNPTHQAVWATRFATELSVFERVFVSSELGYRKPDPEAFHAVAKISGVEPSRFVFFDDTPENLEGALAAGMQAVLVRDSTDVRGALVSLGLPAVG